MQNAARRGSTHLHPPCSPRLDNTCHPNTHPTTHPPVLKGAGLPEGPPAATPWLSRQRQGKCPGSAELTSKWEQLNRQAGGRPGRRAGGQAGRQVGGQAGGQAGRRAGGQARSMNTAVNVAHTVVWRGATVALPWPAGPLRPTNPPMLYTCATTRNLPAHRPHLSHQRLVPVHPLRHRAGPGGARLHAQEVRAGVVGADGRPKKVVDPCRQHDHLQARGQRWDQRPLLRRALPKRPNKQEESESLLLPLLLVACVVAWNSRILSRQQATRRRRHTTLHLLGAPSRRRGRWAPGRGRWCGAAGVSCRAAPSLSALPSSGDSGCRWGSGHRVPSVLDRCEAENWKLEAGSRGGTGRHRLGAAGPCQWTRASRRGGTFTTEEKRQSPGCS